MQPQITALFNELAKRIQQLRDELKNPSVELGHRSIFDHKRSGEVPRSPDDPSYFLSSRGWAPVSSSSGIGSGSNIGSGQPILSGTSDAGVMRFYTVTGSAGVSFSRQNGGAGDTYVISSLFPGDPVPYYIDPITAGTEISTGPNVYRIDDFQLTASVPVFIVDPGDADDQTQFGGFTYESVSPIVFLVNGGAGRLSTNTAKSGSSFQILHYNEDSLPENRILIPGSASMTVPLWGVVVLARNVEIASALTECWQVIATSETGLSGTLNAAIQSLSGTINSAIVSLSGTINARFAAGGGGGEVNTASNVGTGVGLFKQKSTFDLEFKTLSGSYLGGLTGTLISNTSEVVIQTDASPLSGTMNAGFVNLSGTVDGHFNQLSGTINSAIFAITASNVGTGAGFFQTKVGTTLQFKTLSGSYLGLLTGTIISNPNEIVFQVDASPLSSTLDSAIKAVSVGTGSSIVIHDQTLTGSGTSQLPLGVRNRANLWDYPNDGYQHYLDDEFESGTLNSAWQGVLAAASVTYGISPYVAFSTGSTRLSTDMRRSWLMVQPPATTTSAIFLKNAIPLGGADFIMWARMSTFNRSTTVTTNDGLSALIMGDSGTLDSANPQFNNFVSTIVANPASATVSQYAFYKTQGGVATVSFTGEDHFVTKNVPQPYETVAIQKVGTTYHGWGFDANGNGTYMGSYTWTGSLNYVGFFFLNSSTAAPGNTIGGIDFIRFRTGSTWLP